MNPPYPAARKGNAMPSDLAQAFDHTHVDPCWSVVLDDGTQITQGDGVIFKDVPLFKVRQLVVTFAGHVHIIDLPGGTRRPVYFSKVQKRLNPETGDAHDERRIVCVGWQDTVKGVNVKSLVWLDADGTVWHGDDDPAEW